MQKRLNGLFYYPLSWALSALVCTRITALGRCVHPMSPIRAQGINMALRDVIVAANYLVPLLREGATDAAIDAVLPQIQAEREPEIIRAQQLQSQEAAQAELLRKSALLRWGVSQLAPLLGKE
jgi:2-polyprenyl-6-methoxyphenol hydroxylase-like FAD-dependent oxidoreductase